MHVVVLVEREECDLCGLCVEYCPGHVFSIRDNQLLVNESKCLECYVCIPICPKRAIRIEVYNGQRSLFK